MRRAMICVSIMLAMLQVWPMMFGHRTVGAGAVSVAASLPKTIPAVALASSKPRIEAAAAVSTPLPKSCYRQYQAKFGQCPAGDQACHVKVADDWDLCEATGVWPRSN